MLFVEAKRGAGECCSARAAHLRRDAVDLSVLLVDLAAHVHGHRLQVAEDAAHRLQVLLHLVLAGVIGNPAHMVERGVSDSSMRVVAAAGADGWRFGERPQKKRQHHKITSITPRTVTAKQLNSAKPLKQTDQY